MTRTVSSHRGFTLTELVVVLVFAGLLASVAVPSYTQYVARARIARAIGDVSAIDLAIERFRLHNEDRIPDALNELSIAIPLDPWGQPYAFLNIRDAGNVGAARKDGNLVPINTDYDLYSLGADGMSASPLPAAPSRDDIVRANNGAFIGLAEEY